MHPKMAIASQSPTEERWLSYSVADTDGERAAGSRYGRRKRDGRVTSHSLDIAFESDVTLPIP